MPQNDPFARHIASVEAPEPAARPYRRRFAIGVGALGLAAAAAVGGSVFALTSTHRPADPTAWSTWRPTASDQDGLDQIARHVAGEYRFTNGKRLVGITAGLGDTLGVPLRPAVFVAKPGSRDGDIPGGVPQAGTTVFYRFCGSAAACALAGTPSPRRLSLIRRQALEVALYTMHYNRDVDSVLVLLPPVTVVGDATTTPPDLGLYFRRAQLRDQLRAPLARTLSKAVPTPETITPRETKRVGELTEPRSFAVISRQLNDGTPVLLLDRLLDQIIG